MKKLLLAVTMFAVFGTARAVVVTPDALIKSTVQDVTTIIKHDQEIQAGNQKKIVALVDSKVLPNFDFTRMTQLAVGKYWRTATPEQKQLLTSEFRNMLVRTYTKVFTVYRDQAIEVKPLKMAADATEATVQTVISKPGTSAVSVNYEMKKSADGWKAFDIVIEGASMVMSYRGTFASEIQANGIDGLIKSLAAKNANPTDDAPTRKASAK
ncbi:MAG: ABC transporter substrate-binding protein [Gallionella sp.]